jgi:hypothetical protein
MIEDYLEMIQGNEFYLWETQDYEDVLEFGEVVYSGISFYGVEDSEEVFDTLESELADKAEQIIAFLTEEEVLNIDTDFTTERSVIIELM